MRPNERDPVGNVPDNCPVALILVDVVNPLDFPEAEQFLRCSLPAAERLQSLKGRAKAAGIPVIYANDNFGRWRSDLSQVVNQCLSDECKGRPIVELLRPDPDDYFVLKPKHSAFYSTALEILLQSLEAETLIIGGFAADICVLFTANDAYMRGYHVIVPSDGVAANLPADRDAILSLMRRVLKAETPRIEDIHLSDMIRSSSGNHARNRPR